MAHHMQKEYYKALEAYDKGMKIDPNYPELVEWTEKTTQAIQRMHTAGGKEEAEAARQVWFFFFFFFFYFLIESFF